MVQWDSLDELQLLYQNLIASMSMLCLYLYNLCNVLCVIYCVYKYPPPPQKKKNKTKKNKKNKKTVVSKPHLYVQKIYNVLPRLRRCYMLIFQKYGSSNRAFLGVHLQKSKLGDCKKLIALTI